MFGGTDVTQLVAPNAVAAHISAAEVGRLRRDPAVSEIAPDVSVEMQPPGSAPASPSTSAVPAPRRSTLTKATTCPFNPAGPSRPLQEPEADTEIHASNGTPHAPDEANSIAWIWMSKPLSGRAIRANCPSTRRAQTPFSFATSCRSSSKFRLLQLSNDSMASH